MGRVHGCMVHLRVLATDTASSLHPLPTHTHLHILPPYTPTPQVVHSSVKYGHPANWAGYLLMGNDIVLRDRTADLAKSFQSMLQAPLDYLLATLRTLQSMVSVGNPPGLCSIITMDNC